MNTCSICGKDLLLASGYEYLHKHAICNNCIKEHDARNLDEASLVATLNKNTKDEGPLNPFGMGLKILSPFLFLIQCGFIATSVGNYDSGNATLAIVTSVCPYLILYAVGEVIIKQDRILDQLKRKA